MIVQATDQLWYVTGSYAVAGLIALALVVWVMLDYRAQRTRLAQLEQSGDRKRTS